MTENARGRSRRSALAAVALAAFAVLLVAGLRFGDRQPHHPAPAAVSSAAERAAAPVASRSAPRAAPTAAPTARPSTAATRPPHDHVPQSAPTRFRIEGPAFGITARVCGMAYVRPLDPPGDQRHTVCWVRHDFGVAPGSAAPGTTYVLGHAWAEAPLVLNRLSETAMRQAARVRPVRDNGIPIRAVTVLDGYRLTLWTGTGRLIYRVYRAFAVPKQQAGQVPQLMDESVRNRVVLITCGELNGVDYDDNVVAYARLQSSRALNRR